MLNEAIFEGVVESCTLCTKYNVIAVWSVLWKVPVPERVEVLTKLPLILLFEFLPFMQQAMTCP
jgi:hypothetical protein